MVAGAQDLGDGPAVVLRRAGVLWVLEQAGAEALVGDRLGVAEDPREQPYDRVHHHPGRRVARRQDVVADRQLPVDVAMDALVDPLVTAADQRHARAGGELPSRRLVEAP